MMTNTNTAALRTATLRAVRAPHMVTAADWQLLIEAGYIADLFVLASSRHAWTPAGVAAAAR